MSIAHVYKNGEVVFFVWISESNMVNILTRKENDGEGKTCTMTKTAAREYWKNLQDVGYRQAT